MFNVSCLVWEILGNLAIQEIVIAFLKYVEGVNCVSAFKGTMDLKKVGVGYLCYGH